MTPLPTLVSAKKTREGLYIGRAFAGFAASPFQNPYSVGEDTFENRVEAVWKFTKWFLSQPQRMALHELRDAKQFVCWCVPSLCHGHVLQWLLAHQTFHDTPCPACGKVDAKSSIMNGFDKLNGEIMVYESLKCPCQYYRFRHVVDKVNRLTIPAWAAEKELEPSS